LAKNYPKCIFFSAAKIIENHLKGAKKPCFSAKNDPNFMFFAQAKIIENNLRISYSSRDPHFLYTNPNHMANPNPKYRFVAQSGLWFRVGIDF
jgi:hypothetical protein